MFGLLPRTKALQMRRNGLVFWHALHGTLGQIIVNSRGRWQNLLCKLDAKHRYVRVAKKNRASGRPCAEILRESSRRKIIFR
jgi:hypothetical protein